MKNVCRCLLLCCVVSQAADITSSGDWAQSIGAAELTSGAGSDLTSQYEAAAGGTVQNVSNTSGTAWRVKVRRSNVAWDSNVRLWVRRTSDGSGPGTITGGSSYVEVTSIDSEAYAGTGDRNNLGLQFKLTGVSKNVSPSTYNTTVIFTLE